jgi:hypothetical protein
VAHGVFTLKKLLEITVYSGILSVLSSKKQVVACTIYRSLKKASRWEGAGLHMHWALAAPR